MGHKFWPALSVLLALACVFYGSGERRLIRLTICGSRVCCKPVRVF